MDVVILEAFGKDLDSATLKKMPSDMPWGVWLKDGNSETVKLLKEAGCDFIVFPASAPLAIVEDKETGKVLEIDISDNDSMLRSVAELPVDALLVSVKRDEAESLTWQDLMIIQRFGGIPTKPLMALIPENVTVSEIEALWQAGVLAVISEGNTGTLRDVIDKADFKASRKRDKVEPVLRQVDSSDMDDEDWDE
jgi:hypothetical protein